MATTPEGKVKNKVREIFKRHLTSAPHLLYIYWPVPGGFGAPSLDVIGCANGRFFAVETKAKGKKLTAQQVKTATDMRAARGIVFEIIGDQGLLELDLWLKGVLQDADGIAGTQGVGDPVPSGRGEPDPSLETV
jgi:hypothetical protein